MRRDSHRNTTIMTKPRKDPAAHVSLSSDAIVKQQQDTIPAEPRKIPPKQLAPRTIPQNPIRNLGG
jgi:hypothetical protein